MAWGADGPYFVWQVGSRIDTLSPKGKFRSVSANGVDPVVAASADGKLVIAAWNESGIRAAHLSAGK
jgi:hypothetical protein